MAKAAPLRLDRLPAILTQIRGDRTLTEVAKSSGLFSVSHLSKLEAGGAGRDLPVRTLIKLSDAYGVSVWWLFDQLTDLEVDDLVPMLESDSARLRALAARTGMAIMVQAELPGGLLTSLERAEGLVSQIEGLERKLDSLTSSLTDFMLSSTELLHDVHAGQRNDEIPAVLQSLREEAG